MQFNEKYQQICQWFEEVFEMFPVYFERICQDMMEPVGYLRYGILGGVIFVIAWSILCRIFFRKNPITKKKMAALFLCVVYMIVLLNLAFFSREPGSRIGVDLHLFETWGTSVVSRSYVLENVIMFVPFGLFFPGVIKLLRRGWICVTAGMLFSICLEGMQLYTGRGYCQLDDVLTNTLGTFLGWILFCIWHKCIWKPHLRKVWNRVFERT